MGAVNRTSDMSPCKHTDSIGSGVFLFDPVPCRLAPCSRGMSVARIVTTRAVYLRVSSDYSLLEVGAEM